MTSQSAGRDPQVAALHLRSALVSHRRQVERDGGAVPPLLVQLEDLFGVSEGQAGSISRVCANCCDGVPVSPRVLTYSQAALSMGVSVSTVKRLVALGDLPAVRIGGAVRIRVTDLDAYLAALNPTKELV